MDDMRALIDELLLTAGVEDEKYPDLLKGLAQQVAQRGLKTIGIAGSQGSGKSTLARCLGELLERAVGLQCAVLSLDDFYQTRAARAEMARQQHPLFSVRGVPGTHDVVWMHKVIGRLLQGYAADVPDFDKGRDDRVGLRSVPAGVDVVILEGWCFGARPEPKDRLTLPVNALEMDQDRAGIWRRAVNQNLASQAYQTLFDVEFLVYLKAPDLESIHRWRVEQERRFNSGPEAMDPEQIRNFIQYYQRITEWMIEDLPSTADIVVALSTDHGIDEVTLRAGA
ncbi:MAG: hypothetical protein ACPHRE_03955 [Pseudomonadales bacterium]